MQACAREMRLGNRLIERGAERAGFVALVDVFARMRHAQMQGLHNMHEHVYVHTNLLLELGVTVDSVALELTRTRAIKAMRETIVGPACKHCWTSETASCDTVRLNGQTGISITF